MATVSERMRDKLERDLAPSQLEIVDESAQHAGHAAAPDGGESHFRIAVVSARFAGLGRLARHRLVHQVLSAELAGPVHALSIDARAPDES